MTYRNIEVPADHPVQDRKRAAEHVIKAERVLGRRLRAGEVVHHVDHDTLNNDNSNLLICTQSYHMALHARENRMNGPGWKSKSGAKDRTKINIILTASEYDRIKAKAEQTGESMATMIRAATIEKHYPKEKAS